MKLIHQLLLVLLLWRIFPVEMSAANHKSRAEDSLSGIFKTPGDSVQTSVYWYWISGYISEDGVRKDLEAMKRAGIVRNPEALLQPFDGKLAVASPQVCVLSTRDGGRSAVLLDFGRELCGGVEIAAPIRSSQKAFLLKYVLTFLRPVEINRLLLLPCCQECRKTVRPIAGLLSGTVRMASPLSMASICSMLSPVRVPTLRRWTYHHRFTAARGC